MTERPFAAGPDAAAMATLRAAMDGAEDEEALTSGQLPGFLFALACAPETVPPSEWLTEIFGTEPRFRDQEHAQVAFDAVMALYNQVNFEVLEERLGVPPGWSFETNVLDNFKPDSPAGAWSSGFLRGHTWVSEDWSVYLDSEIEEEVVMCLFVLGFFSSQERAELAAEDENLPLIELAGRVRGLFEAAVRSYSSIGRSIHDARVGSGTGSTGSGASPVVVPESTGRNEPCPCGSGRKFKKCCGRAAH